MELKEIITIALKTCKIRPKKFQLMEPSKFTGDHALTGSLHQMVFIWWINEDKPFSYPKEWFIKLQNTLIDLTKDTKYTFHEPGFGGLDGTLFITFLIKP